MSLELDPLKQTSVSLSNVSWVFITEVLRNLSYGSLVDADQYNLLAQINSQIIAANQTESQEV